MSNKILLKSHNDLQNMYRKVINLIEDKKEREIIHCLFQDLSDKLLDSKDKPSKTEILFFLTIVITLCIIGMWGIHIIEGVCYG